MEAVVTEGTGKDVFKDFPFPVAGKTGTAHVADGDLGYHDGVYQASFAGYFPADKPQYTCIVVIKTKPHAPLHFGGQLAAPVFREVATKMYALYIQQKTTAPAQLPVDSLQRFFAGNTDDVKEIMDEVGVVYKDSSNKNVWGIVSEMPEQTTLKAV